MRSLIVGLLCVTLAVFVAARYPYQKTEDIDAEVEALERAVRAREQAIDERRLEGNEKREERGLDLDELTDGEFEELLGAVGGHGEEDENRRSFGPGQKEKKGWIRFRYPRLPRIPIPRYP